MDNTKQTKVFRIEILKPINYTWKEFNSILNPATHASAKLANEVMTKKLLLSKKEIKKESSFCSMITLCKTTELSFNAKCAACRQAQLKYQSLAKKLLRSDISLPTFKNNCLYIVARGVKIERQDDDFMVRLSLLPGRNAKQPEVMLRTSEIKKKSPGYYQILQRITDGGYKLGFCQIKKDKVRNKLYLLMSYSFENGKETSLVESRVVGVDLGIATPAYCALNDSVKRLSLYMEGKKLLRVKYQIQARRRGIMREITRRELRRGHGLSGKFTPMQQLEQKWINFRQTWNHVLSNRIVDFALREKAGTIHIEDLSNNGNTPRYRCGDCKHSWIGNEGNCPHCGADKTKQRQERQFLGRDWPVAELLQMITYKGTEAGMEVKRVNPYKTSQTCSRCGAIRDNFTFKERARNGFPVFDCDCGFQDDADYNAAKNIARSTLITK